VAEELGVIRQTVYRLYAGTDERVTSPEAMAFGRAMLTRMNVDWAACGYRTDELDGLVEFGLRVLQSLVLAPPRRRGGARLRSFLQRWVAPAVRAAGRPA
jgi:hypothetical protein